MSREATTSKEVWQFLKAAPCKTSEDVGKAMGISRNTASAVLSRLFHADLVYREKAVGERSYFYFSRGDAFNQEQFTAMSAVRQYGLRPSHESVGATVAPRRTWLQKIGAALGFAA